MSGAKLGFRNQESEARSRNQGHLPPVFTFMRTAYCLLPAFKPVVQVKRLEQRRHLLFSA